MDQNLRIITDRAFEVMDTDGSGGLDTDELKVIMDKVAEDLGIQGPTNDDLESMLAQLDDDFDGIVSSEEFF